MADADKGKIVETLHDHHKDTFKYIRDREKQREEKNKDQRVWEKHWEKKDQEGEKNKPKKLGGGKRPKFFNYRNDEVDFEKIKEEAKMRNQSEVSFEFDQKDAVPENESGVEKHQDFRKNREK